MMLQNRNTSNTSNKQSNARRGRIPQQAKEVHCAIMDCILSEMEKTKEDRLLNCEIGTTERKVNFIWFVMLGNNNCTDTGLLTITVLTPAYFIGS